MAAKEKSKNVDVSALQKDELEDLLDLLIDQETNGTQVESVRAPKRALEMFTALSDTVLEQDDNVKYLAVRIYEEFLPLHVRQIKEAFQAQLTESDEPSTWEEYHENNQKLQPLRILSCILIASKMVGINKRLTPGKAWETLLSQNPSLPNYGTTGVAKSETRILETLSWKLPWNRSFDTYVDCLYGLTRLWFPLDQVANFSKAFSQVKAICFVLRDELPCTDSQLTQAAAVIIGSFMLASDYETLSDLTIRNVVEIIESLTQGFITHDEVMLTAFSLVNEIKKRANNKMFTGLSSEEIDEQITANLSD